MGDSGSVRVRVGERAGCESGVVCGCRCGRVVLIEGGVCDSVCVCVIVCVCDSL